VRISQIQFPGQAPHRFAAGLNVVGGLDAAERRRWVRALTGRGDGRLWIDDATQPTDLTLTPEMAESMVVRASDLDLARDGRPRPVGNVEVAVEPAPGAFALQEAFARWRQVSDRAADHAGEVRRLVAEWARITAGLSAPAPSPDDEDRVEAARFALERTATDLAVARSAHSAATLSPENVDTVHGLHAEVVRAEAQAARPLVGVRGRQRLAAALREEADFLRHLGVPSYTAFLLEGLDGLAAGAAIPLAEAEKAAAEAEAAWRALGGLEARVRERAQLERHSHAIRRRVADIMGAEPDDVDAILETWPRRVPAVAAARADLEAALEAAGVDPGPDAAATARDWLVRSTGTALAIDAASLAVPQGSDGERVEMYLLGRLAAHASGHAAGSLPIVFDEALAGLPEPMWNRALAVLQRAAATVQVIYLTADSDEPVDVDVADHPAAAGEVAVDVSDRAVASRANPPAAPEGERCTAHCHAPAVATCERCHHTLCEQHTVRVRSSARTLCQACALAVAGVSRGRLRR
jgi:hypothetical protein